MTNNRGQVLSFNICMSIRKNIFACLFSVHNTISLSCHEQVCLMRQLINLLYYLYVYIFERSISWRYSSSLIVRSTAIPTKASNIWSGVTYLPFSRILNCFLFVFFELTFCRYVLKHDKA